MVEIVNLETKMKLKNIKNLMALAFALPCLILGSAVAQAQEIKERTLKFAYVQPKGSHMGFGVEKFSELVAKKSGNKIIVKGYSDGSLGSDLNVLNSLQGGTIEMTTMPPSLMVGQVKAYGAFSIHFLFGDFKEADAVLDGPVGKKFLEKAPKGVVGLAYWDHGFRNISNSRRPIAKVEDIQGLKLRVVQEPLFVDSFTALGANPVPLAFTELYSAMETKAVDGQDNPIAAFEANKFYEVQKYLSSTRHVYQPLIVLINSKVWAQLSPAERKIIQDAANETAIEQRQVSRKMEAQALETVRKQGVNFTDVSPQERAHMRERVKPVTDKYLQDMSSVDPLPAELVKAVEAQRSKK
jgi:tripartite ATP-independent transporter DctP family solute receptor